MRYFYIKVFYENIDHRLGWRELSNRLNHVLISVDHNPFEHFPTFFTNEVIHGWLISIEVFFSHTENCKTTWSQCEKHISEYIIVAAYVRGCDNIIPALIFYWKWIFGARKSSVLTKVTVNQFSIYVRSINLA